VHVRLWRGWWEGGGEGGGAVATVKGRRGRSRRRTRTREEDNFGAPGLNFNWYNFGTSFFFVKKESDEMTTACARVERVSHWCTCDARQPASRCGHGPSATRLQASCIRKIPNSTVDTWTVIWVSGGLQVSTSVYGGGIGCYGVLQGATVDYRLCVLLWWSMGGYDFCCLLSRSTSNIRYCYQLVSDYTTQLSWAHFAYQAYLDLVRSVQISQNQCLNKANTASGKVFCDLQANKAISSKMPLDKSCSSHWGLQLLFWIYFWIGNPHGY
jgi:hypothetical protein